LKPSFAADGGRSGQAAHEVIFDGEALQSPFGRDANPPKQAKRNAAWLSDFLRNVTGEPVEVFPLVVCQVPFGALKTGWS
jgi:hypothetical protein